MSRGGAPPWVYRREMAIRDASHQSQQSNLHAKIRKLENEKEELLKRIAELEKENEQLKRKIKR